MDRIVKNGNSSLLLQLAKRVGNAAPSKATTESMNVVAMTMLNHPMGEKTKMKARVVIEKSVDLVEGDGSTEGIEVRSSACNEPSVVKWRLDVYSGLKELVMGDDCLQHVSELVLSGFARLESVEIGMHCFSSSFDGEMEVGSCDALKRVVVGDGCCERWSSFVMRNCDSLQEVSIGDGCFVRCENTVFESACCLNQNED